MQCGCQIDFGYNECGPDAFRAVDRKAIKEHRCFECGRVIRVGEVYRCESGIWENGPKTYKTCHDCLSIRDVYFCEYIYGELHEKFREYVSEADGEILDSNITRLTDAAKDLVFGLIEKEWNDWYIYHPVEPAARLDTKMRRKRSWRWPEWMHQRHLEIYRFNRALI